ncbi:ATP-binding protein [Caballeronia ptereochthonis]|uniref:Virulence sensor protein BvgS n=1 Tax=Caballeronia ptereochthonis TaxID=1777144 RepID=A0A158BZ31_9BURK|nr:transporter substrate-binding domain-containing protein [Caballeronia ptereochthonis]SAK75358.1 sensor protein evgS [Caballeronia ptereochthonis]
MSDHASHRGAARAGLARFVFIVLTCVPSVLWVPGAGAQERIVIGTAPGVAPPLDMAYAASRNAADSAAPRGISVDYANAVADALGVKPQWRLYPNRAALIAALARGDIDLATGATGEDSGAALAYSRPYLPVKQVFVEPLARRPPTHRLAYVDAQTSPARLRKAYPSLQPAAYPDLIGALLAVSLGDADAFVGDMTAAAYAIRHFELPNLTITNLAAFDEDGYRFAFAADRAGASTLRHRVDEALAALPPAFLLVARARWGPGASAITLEKPIELTAEEAAWVRAHPVVHYSMLSQGAPLTFRDSRGQPAGAAVDILDAIARVTGLRFEARVRDSQEQLAADLKSGASPILPYGAGDASAIPGGVSTVPTGEGILAIVTAAGQPPLRDAAALAGKRIALPASSLLRNLVRQRAPDVRFVDTRPLDGQFHAVAKGAADATIADLAFANYALGNPYRGVLVMSGVLSTRPVPHGLTVAASEPVLLGIVDRAIAHLPPEELEAIRTRWKLSEHPEMLWERRRPQVALGALLGGALLLVLAGWALTLRVQIARRIAAENAMRAAKEEAETANRAKSTFLATMSHEIRTPMNAVLGLLEMELRAPGERAATERALSTAHRAARDLLGMIDDLLDVAKIEAERLMLAPAPLEIEAWIAGVAAIYEPAARAKGIALVVKRQGERGPAWVLADGQRLRQVVGNLLSNAIKFTDIGAVTLEYGVGPRCDGKRAVTLAVSDTGIGIAPERQAALFTPFVQAHDGRARSFGGTGLGLTISKRLVTMMGGVIELSSEPGRGTRFTVRIGFPEAAAVASPVEAQPAAASASVESLAGLRVLVVDDHPANRIVLDGQIRLLGGTAELAVDGKRALARWRAGPRAFDVILTDCSMPEMSGEELTRAIRDDEANDASKPRPVPIVGLTANAQPDAAARAIAAGMTACLVKPLSLDGLRAALIETTRERRAPVASVAAPKPHAVTPGSEAGAFDRALLEGFGDQAGTLVDTLKSAHAQDLADARAAFDDCDWSRLRDTAHRMKGAAAVIGAAPFMRACVALQHDCDCALDEDRNGEDDPRIAASFAAFVAAAEALDAALDGAPAPRTA